jgi:hypothetical protein
MVQIDDVKQLSHEIVESHNARGFALVRLTPTEPQPVGVLLNVTKEPWVTKGKALKAKADVRRFLWDQSKTARVRRKARTFVWTRYMRDEDVSVMGLATVVTREVAERMSQRDEGYSWIEVQQ